MKRIQKNKILLVLGAILLLAAFLRIYNISQYQTFLGDEGRDALIAKGILEGDFTLLGPRASAGDFFLGPIYYYFMAPFLLLSSYDPVGPAIMVALFSVATVYLIYRFGREWFGLRSGLIAATLYAVSPLVIAYSRSSWNPNPLPFFSLLSLYLLWKGIVTKSWKLFVIAGVLLGIAMQLHYLAVFLGVICAVFIFFGSWVQEKKLQIKNVINFYLGILAGFLIGLSPFLLFEIRHGFPNIKTIFNFIFINNAQAGYEGTGASYFEIVENVFFKIFGRLVLRYPSPELQDMFSSQSLQIWHFISLILAVCSVLILLKLKNKLTLLLFTVWLFLGVLLFGFYKKSIYDYYFEFMFPLPFLLVGNALGEGLLGFIKKNWAVVLGTGVFIAILLFNLSDMPFRYPPHNQKQAAENLAKFVLSKTDNRPYNFALLTRGNSDHAYRYFFHIRGRDPVVIENNLIDPKRTSVTDQLLIICDYSDCKPLGHPLFEVAGFGRAEIVGQWKVGEVVVFKLIPYNGPEE